MIHHIEAQVLVLLLIASIVGMGARRLKVPYTLALVVADTLPVQMKIMGEGLSLGQVGQRPFEMGYKAMYMLLDIKNGKDVVDPTYTGLDVCTPKNGASWGSVASAPPMLAALM